MSAAPETFPRAPCALPCCDAWPPGALTDLHRAAYDRLARLGTIRPDAAGAVRVDPWTGRTIVRYWSSIPHEWALEALGEIKAEVARPGA